MRRIRVSIVLAVLALAGACGTDNDDNTTEASVDDLIVLAESLCQKDADCEGKDSAWIKACLEEADNQITAAEHYGCLDIMAVWFNCLDDNSKCTVEDEDPDKDYTDQGACSDQEELAENCRKGRL